MDIIVIKEFYSFILSNGLEYKWKIYSGLISK